MCTTKPRDNLYNHPNTTQAQNVINKWFNYLSENKGKSKNTCIPVYVLNFITSYSYVTIALDDYIVHVTHSLQEHQNNGNDCT